MRRRADADSGGRAALIQATFALEVPRILTARAVARHQQTPHVSHAPQLSTTDSANLSTLGGRDEIHPCPVGAKFGHRVHVELELITSLPGSIVRSRSSGGEPARMAPCQAGASRVDSAQQAYTSPEPPGTPCYLHK